MQISRLTSDHIEDAKRIITTVVLEFYFDGYSVDQLLEHYSKVGYLSDVESLETSYDGNNGIMLGIFDGTKLVGVGGVKKLSDEVGELVRMWLLPNYRHRGLGRETIGMLISFSKQNGVKRLKLDTSRKCSDAISLFKKVGFKEVSSYKESIGDCFMELDLTIK